MKNNILSIDYDDKDNMDYESFKKFTESHTEREKDSFALLIDDAGDSVIQQMDKNTQKRVKIKQKLIKYILKHNKDEDENVLMSYELETLREIKSEIKNNKRSFLIKIVQFFNN